MAPLGRLFGSASGGSDRGDGDRADPGAGDGRSPDDRPRVGLFVDGPNALREEFDVDLDDVREVAGQYGRLARVGLYLDEHAPPSLIRAAEARGFAVVTTSGDVDVRLAVDATAAVVDGTVDVLVICSRDADFKPVVERAAERGVATVAVAPGEYGRSDALSNAVDDAVSVGPE